MRQAGQRQPGADHDASRATAPTAAIRTTPALRLDGRPPGAQRERQQDRRQEQADRQRDVDDEQDREQVRGHRDRLYGGRRSGRRRASRATQSPSAVRSATSQPGRLEGRPDLRLAVDEDARCQERRRPGDSSVARGPARAARARRDEVGEHDVERRLARRAGCRPRARMRRTSRLRRAFASVASIGDRVRVDAERAVAPRGATAAIARMPEPQPDVEDARAGQRARGRPAARGRPGTAGSSGAARSRRPSPGRGRGRRRRAARRWRRQVGRMTRRRPMRRTGK